MKHTIQQWETALVKMRVMVSTIKAPEETITEVSGFLDNVRYTWNAAGHCFRCKDRVPKYDIVFMDEFAVSIDQNHIAHLNIRHIFKAPFFQFNVKCSKCSLVKECTSIHSDDFPFPCLSEKRTDKKNGYFKLKTQ